MEALYGLPFGTFSGTYSAWQLLIHPDDRHVISAFERAPNEQALEGEWRVTWPDGSVHWLLGRAWLFRDQDGNPERWIGADIDITGQNEWFGGTRISDRSIVRVFWRQFLACLAAKLT